MRKAIQLHNHDGDLYALCDDGTIWQMTGNGWSAVEPIPHDNEPTEPQALKPLEGVEKLWAPLEGVGKLWAVASHRVDRISFEEHAVEAVRAGLSLAEADTSSRALMMVAEGIKGGWSRQSYKGSYIDGKWTPLFYYLSEIPF